jgi:transposase InsO family protein
VLTPSPLATPPASCAIAWYAASGISVKAVMSDNGSAYISDHYARTLRRLGLRHLRIKPRRPRTNGKAERLIQTLLKEWAYARIYGSSNERTTALPPLPQPIQLPTTRQPQPPTTGVETEQRRW